MGRFKAAELIFDTGLKADARTKKKSSFAGPYDPAKHEKGRRSAAQ